MANPLSAFIEKNAAAARLKRQMAGLAADFWKDTPCAFPAFELKLLGRTLKVPNVLKPMPAGAQPSSPLATPNEVAAVSAPPPPVDTRPRWHAQPGELAEKMWGEEQIWPAGDEIFAKIAAPLALTKDKVILDLSAGLGGQTRKLAGQVGQMKGLEVDAAIATRGMELSTRAGKAKQAPIEAYDPTTFSMPAIYDAMIARELFYCVADKGRFFYSIGAGIKAQGQVGFTDYIVDPENRQQPAIVAWQAQEKGASPLGLIEMAEAWAKAGFELKASEDMTAFYRGEIVKGINRFVAVLRAAPPPDAETKKGILREVETWILRLAAIQAGMKFYRFQAVKS